RPDGSWTYYYYDAIHSTSDQVHTLKNLISSCWIDTPVDFTSLSDVENHGHMLAYFYPLDGTFPNGPDNDNSILLSRPRLVSESFTKIVGTQTASVALSNTWHGYKVNQDQDLCHVENRVTGTGSYGSGGTITRTTYTGMDEGRPKAIVFPDGRIDNYSYDYAY